MWSKLKSARSILLSIIAILLIAIVPKSYSLVTNLGIDPGRSTPYLGQSFTVNVTVADVTSLNSWQIALSFDPRILNCTGAFVPSGSIFAGYSYFFPTPTINNAIGRIAAFCSLEGSGTNVSGSGKLLTINFTSQNLEVSALTFMNIMKKQIDGTYLLDPNGSIIPFTATGGIVEVLAPGFQLNIFNVTQNLQTFSVGVWTNSTVTDFYFNDSFKELSFNVTGLDGTNGICIVEIPESLLNGTLITLINKVGISTYARTLGTLPENTTYCFTDFSFSHSIKNVKIRLTVVGDLTGDRKDDIQDLAKASAAFGSYLGSLNWNPAADMDHNLKIDIADVAIVSANFGRWLSL